MVNLVDELKSRYPSRLVLVDLPPVLATDDATTELGLDIPAEADAAYCRFDVMYRL